MSKELGMRAIKEIFMEASAEDQKNGISFRGRDAERARTIELIEREKKRYAELLAEAEKKEKKGAKK